jgi:sigma-B regulation protein RsbU (phosphoserine phosphatase)
MSNSKQDTALDAVGHDAATRLKALIEASQALAKLDSLEKVLPRLIRLAREVTRAEASSLMLYDPVDEVLRFQVVEDTGIDAEAAVRLAKMELKLGQGIGGSVALSRRSELINQAQDDPRLFRDADKNTGSITRNMICTPLVHGKELLGVATALNSAGRERFSQEDLELFESFARLASVAILRARLLEARLEQQRLEDDAAHAASIQKLFWPALPKEAHGSSIWAMSRPAGFVGGDIYDCIILPDESWLIYVADVSGKGMPAALIMTALSTALRSEVISCTQLDRLLFRLNNAMHRLSKGTGFFITMLLGRYQPQTGVMRLARAGHPLPIWHRKDIRTEPPKTGGLPLGTLADVDYEAFEIELKHGDSILMFSDGVSEAMDRQGKLFEPAALDDYLQVSGPAPRGPGLAKAVDKWQQGVEPNDDLTIMEIWRR